LLSLVVALVVLIAVAVEVLEDLELQQVLL